MHKIALIGRPNVGKSTLFNKIARKTLALVNDTAGLTRDWQTNICEVDGIEFELIDTAGIEESFDASIEARMRQKTEQAMAQADLTVFLFDAYTGLTPLDHHFAQWIREQGYPTLVVANKCDTKVGKAGYFEGFELGLGEPIPVSAEHAQGFHLLLDEIIAFIKKTKPKDQTSNDLNAEEDEEYSRKIAIIGRPNVGKSTLLNALIGEERVMTGPEAGVTRDAIAVDWIKNNQKYRLVDTAGLRKKAKIHEDIEKMSAHESKRAIRLANIVILVLDAELAFDKQDLSLAHMVIEEGRCLIIAINKWDAANKKLDLLKHYQDKLETALPQVKGIPFITISAKNKKNLDKLIDESEKLYQLWNARISTGELNRWLAETTDRHPPPLASGRRIRLKYMTQIKTRPPTFAIWITKPVNLPESYLKYIKNKMREDFNLPAVPIRFVIKKGKNPYDDKK